ncbi:putative transcriptional regulator [Lactococcus lactis subsp. lactis]|uniref:TetR family transcriptional regulator n=1 Tax=Lactococcus lactis TaxID=1358 RepID=UPI00071CB7F8|nr:TetR family transcriptional regulator [Lactococcus lactis]KST86991.1 putative transcriptional regulator [Lactococcus lactis subsp. lactis]
MTKDTKEIIIRTLLNIASESQKVTIEEISKRSHITRTTIKNNFKTGVPGIVEYIYLNIVDEVNERLLQYNCEDVTIELLADLLLPVLWQHKEEAHIIFGSQLPFQLIGPISDRTWKWAEKRFNFLIKEHGLANYFTAQELIKYFNAQLITVLTLWLEADIPIAYEKFRPKFIFFMSTSINELIFKGTK